MPIFLDDEDHAQLLRTLANVCRESGMFVHAYVLMRNHYHLLVETFEGTLASAFHQLNWRYARYLNDRYERTGHVFERRYWSRRIVSDDYFAAVTTYIVRNPLRANLIERAEDWRWSSMPVAVGRSPRPWWLESRYVLQPFAGLAMSPASAYRRHVAEASDELPELTARTPLDRLIDRLDLTSVHAARDLHGYSLREIARHLGMPPSTLARRLTL